MTIIRSPRIQRDFTILSNSVCLDGRLTMRALGVLVRLLARPDNWRTNSEGLAAEFGCGRDAVRGALHELQKAGYIRMQKTQNGSGHWSSSWLVFDEPQTDDEAPGAGKTDAGKPDAGISDAGKAGAITRTDVARTDVARTDDVEATRKRAAPRQKKVSTVDAAWLAAQHAVPVDTGEAWLALRKARNMPLTAKAWELTLQDGASVGLTAEQTVDECIRRGWGAFRADWWMRDQRQSRGPESFRERDARLAAERVKEMTGGLGHDRAALGEAPRKAEPLPFERGYRAPRQCDVIEGGRDAVKRIR